MYAKTQGLDTDTDKLQKIQNSYNIYIAFGTNRDENESELEDNGAVVRRCLPCENVLSLLQVDLLLQ